jgi:hypothetical protein
MFKSRARGLVHRTLKPSCFSLLSENDQQRLAVQVQPLERRLKLPGRVRSPRPIRQAVRQPIPLLNLGQLPPQQRRLRVLGDEFQQRVVFQELFAVPPILRVEPPFFDEFQQGCWGPTGSHDLRASHPQATGRGSAAACLKNGFVALERSSGRTGVFVRGSVCWEGEGEAARPPGERRKSGVGCRPSPRVHSTLARSKAGAPARLSPSTGVNAASPPRGFFSPSAAAERAVAVMRAPG